MDIIQFYNAVCVLENQINELVEISADLDDLENIAYYDNYEYYDSLTNAIISIKALIEDRQKEVLQLGITTELSVSNISRLVGL